jgi:two-component system phosphate regulon sensor histidine kinase PhoR
VLRRDLIVLMPAVWLPVLAALVAVQTGSTPAAAVVSGGVAAVGSTLIVLLYAGLLRRRVSRLNDTAQRLLASGLGAAGEAAGASPIHDDRDLAALQTNLWQLGQRMAGQVKELAKKSRNLEALIDGLDDPVLATDRDDNVLLANRPMGELLGLGGGTGQPGGGGAALLGRNVRTLFTRAEVLAMHTSAKAGKTERARVPLVTPTGVRTFQVSAAPVPAAWGDGVFGVVLALRDVTELAQAIQVRTEFVANASHELRTPVAAIKIAAETLADGAKDDPVMRDRLVAKIADHTQRLEELVRDLMDLSRLETPDLPVHVAPVDLGEIESSLRTLFEPTLRSRRLALQFELDPGLARLATDHKITLLMLRNLVDNATKYAHERTTIRVVGRLAPVPAEPPPAPPRPPTIDERLPADAPAAWVRFEVIDRGVGIPLSQQERVFERFFQADSARTGTGSSSKRGTGLGLAIVKHAARSMGGRIGLESVWQEGTTVWLEWPVRLTGGGS